MMEAIELTQILEGFYPLHKLFFGPEGVHWWRVVYGIGAAFTILYLYRDALKPRMVSGSKVMALLACLILGLLWPWIVGMKILGLLD